MHVRSCSPDVDPLISIEFSACVDQGKEPLKLLVGTGTKVTGSVEKQFATPGYTWGNPLFYQGISLIVKVVIGYNHAVT